MCCFPINLSGQIWSTTKFYAFVIDQFPSQARPRRSKICFEIH